MLREIAASYRHAEGGQLRRRILLTYLFLLAMNVAAWTLAVGLFHSYPAALSLCFLAYGLGLRHAVDADHIAAIDNVTRKLMQQGQKPVCVGFFFSLGHSTVVILMSLLVAEGTGYVREHFPQFQQVGGIIGTSVSACFLLLIAVVNFFVFLDVLKRFNAARRGSRSVDHAATDAASAGGVLSWALRSVFRFVGRSWQMYPIGLLFGLGFDTATEVAVLGIAATQAAAQTPIWSIMVFPLLFTSGMCLVDTTDGVVMLGAYGWAFVKPVRKLFYNMTITFVSFMIALLIGSIEALGVIASNLQLQSGIFAGVNALNEHATAVGYSVIGLMIASWLISIFIYRASGLDNIEQPAAEPE
ncbi:MAG: HoxN/HupN/NixA family nickel/cobalt transporter [Thermoguttaceae bacterium]|jgi:high-affinity nickel-transport protein